MYRLRRAHVAAAGSESPWDVANEVLYSLCRRYPSHDAIGPVLAKINLIGRAYAAAIERRKNKRASEQNDAFYLDTVGPTIIRSDIDQWLAVARKARPATADGLDVLLDVHEQTTALFTRISGLRQGAGCGRTRTRCPVGVAAPTAKGRGGYWKS
jgi:hypothetical protein